jgi:hypothetical protein
MSEIGNLKKKNSLTFSSIYLQWNRLPFQSDRVAIAQNVPIAMATLAKWAANEIEKQYKQTRRVIK